MAKLFIPPHLQLFIDSFRCRRIALRETQNYQSISLIPIHSVNPWVVSPTAVTGPESSARCCNNVMPFESSLSQYLSQRAVARKHEGLPSRRAHRAFYSIGIAIFRFTPSD